MAKNKSKGFDVVLFLITLFLGWFGVDKMYKGDIKIGLIKLLLTFLVIGIFWNIYDIICCCVGRYKINPLK